MYKVKGDNQQDVWIIAIEGCIPKPVLACAHAHYVCICIEGEI